MKAPLISVIIPCYNYGKYVGGAVESVCAQTYPNVEILVVDGGSSDVETLSVVRGLKDKGVRVFLRKKRHLVGDNRNFGVKRAKGDFVCCLDADDEMHPTFLEKALYVLLSGGYDIVSTSMQSFGDADLISPAPEYPSLDESLETNQINTLALVRKKLWMDVGGMKDWGVGENYIFEDWEFWVRCLLAGAKARNISREPLFLYRKHGSDSLSSQFDRVLSLEQHRAAILDSNQEALENWKHGKASGSVDYPKMIQLGVGGKSDFSLDFIVVSVFSDWLTFFEGVTPAKVVEFGKTIVICTELDPRGRQFVEETSKRMRISVFELPGFLDPEFHETFISSAFLLHNPRRCLMYDSSYENWMAVSKEECLRRVQALELAGTRSDNDELLRSCILDLVELEVLDEMNPYSGSNLVWISGVDSTDASIVDSVISRFEQSDEWEKKVCAWAPSGYVYQGRPSASIGVYLPKHAQLTLLAHSDGGKVSFKCQGREAVTVDLYSQSPSYVTINSESNSSAIASFGHSEDQVSEASNELQNEFLVELTVLEEKNEDSHGNEVWLEDIRLPSGASCLSKNLGVFMTDSWRFVANKSAPRGYAFWGNPGERLRLHLPAGSELVFLKHAWSGVVTISYGAVVKTIDLFDDGRQVFRVVLTTKLDENL